MPNNDQYPAKYRKRRKRKKMMRSLLVFGVLLLILVLATLIFVWVLDRSSKVDDPSSGAGSAPAVVVAPPVSSKPVSLPPPASSGPQAPDATGEDDVKIPPLFNRFNLIPDEYWDDFETADVGNGQQMEKQAAAAYNRMKDAAAEEGVTVLPVSGYREHQRQANNYEASINRYLSQGLSREEAVRRTEEYYAIPGSSEHEAGLAMDIGVVDDSFENYDAFPWLQEHAADYGFILRYPDGMQSITYIEYEPWHYRFVGVNHAREMKRLDIATLEEYYEHLDWQGSGIRPEGAEPESSS